MNTQSTLERLFGFPSEFVVTWFITAAVGLASLVGFFISPPHMDDPLLILLAIIFFASEFIMHVLIVLALYWVCKERKFGQDVPQRGYWLLISTTIYVGSPYVAWLAGY
jgi:hypothetical protein